MIIDWLSPSAETRVSMDRQQAKSRKTDSNQICRHWQNENTMPSPMPLPDFPLKAMTEERAAQTASHSTTP